MVMVGKFYHVSIEWWEGRTSWKYMHLYPITMEIWEFGEFYKNSIGESLKYATTFELNNGKHTLVHARNCGHDQIVR